MSEPRGRPTFGQIYRQQYRQISATKTSRTARIITPFILLFGIVFARHSPVFMITIGVLAVLLLAAALLLGRKQRRDNPPEPHLAEARHSEGNDE